MNWKRYKLLIVTGGVSLVAVVVLIILMVRTGSQTAELRNDVVRLKGEQSRLVGMRPFPSQESFTFLQDKHESLQERRDEVKEIIHENQITPIQMSRSLFGDFVRRQFVPPLIAAAADAREGGENGVILRDPSFGLQEYLDGALPDPQEIPDLMIQLETMRHISMALFEAGISELVRIDPRRADDSIRPGPHPRTATPPGGSLFGAATTGGQRGTETPAVETAPSNLRRNELFNQITFTVSIRVYEDKLWDLLNQFSADENQVIVRNLTITNSHQQLWPPYLRPDARMGTPATRAQATRTERRPANPLLAALMNQADTGTTGAEPVAALPGLQERRERVVGGELLNVSFDITFYRLKPVAQGS